MSKIACVIVTFNRKDLLVEAIESVLNQTKRPEYIIVVDNASTDGTSELIHKKFDFDQRSLIYLHNRVNLGGSAGFSTGIEYALKTDCDWISISDDDAIFEKKYFEVLSGAIVKHPKQQVFSGSVLLPDGKHDAMHREKIKNKKTLTVEPVSEDVYATDFMYDIFSFVGVLLSRKIVEVIGLPEKDYFIRFDDFEYAVRARKFGSFMNVYGANVLHKTTYTRQSVSPWKEYYVMRNRIASLIKHEGLTLTTRLYAIRFLLRKLLSIVLFKDRRRQMRLLSNAYIKGYNDGLKNNLGKNPLFLP